MPFTDTYNVSPINAVLSGSVDVMGIFDSIGASELPTTAQGWTTLDWAMKQTWGLGPLEQMTVNTWDSDAREKPSPNNGGDAETLSFGTTKQPTASGNTWSPSASDEGVLGMTNGLELAGTTASNSNLLDINWTTGVMGSMSGTSMHDLVTSSDATAGVLYHGHGNGIDGQLQFTATGSSPVTVAVDLDTSALSGLQIKEVSHNLSAVAGTLRIRRRHRIGDGDQTGNYDRIGHAYIRNNNVSGARYWGCGMGSATPTHWGNDIASGGLMDQAQLNAYTAATGVTAAMVMLGRNSYTDSEAANKTQFANILNRLETAGVTHCLTIGTYWDQTMSDAQATALNRAAQEASQEHVGSMVVGNISLYKLLGQVSAGWLEDSTHPNATGAAEIWAAIVAGVQVVEGGSLRGRPNLSGLRGRSKLTSIGR